MGETKSEEPDENGWDYSEYEITSDDKWIPSTHGGVSGSGVWRIDFLMDGKGTKHVYLVGVAFAEGADNDRKLVAHGKHSIGKFLGEN